MLKVENKSKEEIAEIGRKIGEAFAAEKAGIVTMLTEEQAVKAFEIITECYYRSGVLYTTSETGEGYLAYGDKQTKLAVGPTLHMVKRFLCELPLKASLAVAQSGGEQYAKIFKKERNYIAVSMVVVLREFQGKGFMHKVLEQPFAEADEKNIPCVLDTDTPLKVEKYIRCGMELAGEKKLRHGVSLYTMAYYASPEGGRHP
ncbi:MAG: N-acetyltransferase [Butyrivibrio sp.]|nr:N-acetyltransferase [Butyrivibrio sp.]